MCEGEDHVAMKVTARRKVRVEVLCAAATTCINIL